jgi:hypothetical protein
VIANGVFGRTLQAGTQFWDPKLEEEMKGNRLSTSPLDR